MTATSSSKPIIYREPTYELTLSPQEAPQAHHFKSLTHKNVPYKNLDHLVDEVMKNRYKDDELKGLSQEKTEELRLQAAHSLMERPDQKSSLKIRLPLAKDHGLVDSAKERLATIKDLPKNIDLTPLAEFIFADCKEENFGFILNCKLNMLFGSQSTDFRNAVFQEVCKIRDELRELTSSTMKLYRPPQETDGKSYIDHNGKIVTLSQTIPSSADRDNNDVQNGRCNLDNNGHVIYSAGRIETERKARQVLYRLIHQTFVSGQLKIENLPKKNGIPLYPVVVENLISSSSLAKKEKAYLLKEDEVLKSLSGSNMTITLPTGEEIVVQLQILHFSTQTNYNAFLGQTHGWSCTGSDEAERITIEGTDELERYSSKYFDLQEKSLEDNEIQKSNFTTEKEIIKYCFEKLRTCSRLRDRLMYRGFICELLNIPYHVHCKSSKDRTAAIVAVKKALHMWIKLGAWKGKVDLSDPVELFNNPIFREYSEAAFFENLPMTDQGVGISGMLDGKLYTQNRGFKFQKYIFEHPAPVEALSDRYLYKAPMIERILYATLMLAASIVLTAAYLPSIPLVVIAMYFINQKECLSATLYVFLSILVLPTRSAFREKWLKRDSSKLNERQFFLNQNKPKSDKGNELLKKLAVTKI